MANSNLTQEQILDFDDLQTDFLSLRVGEEIPRLRIKRIRRVINANKPDNLAGVDFKYIIETKDNKVLKVNTWILWKKINAALREAGKVDADLEINHPRAEEYIVNVINDNVQE